SGEVAARRGDDSWICLGGRGGNRPRGRFDRWGQQVARGRAYGREAAICLAAVAAELASGGARRLPDSFAGDGFGWKGAADRRAVESVGIFVERDRSCGRFGGEGMRRLILLGCGLTVAAWCADQATLDRGQKEESRSCVACHSLRLIHSQRLPRA